MRKELSDRVHDCPFCGFMADRDYNAALNIYRLGASLRRNFPGKGRKHGVVHFRLIDILESVGLNPHEGKKLKGSLEGYYSRRPGSYRIIYEIRANNLIVYVIDIGHRREIYR